MGIINPVLEELSSMVITGFDSILRHNEVVIRWVYKDRHETGQTDYLE